MFVISGMVGRNEYTKNDFLVVDLGADGNLLSIGATLNIGGKRGTPIPQKVGPMSLGKSKKNQFHRKYVANHSI